MSATGSMFGLAFGDCMGKPTEFQRFEEIVQLYGPAGPSDLSRGGYVTDDTQMALAVADALLEQPAALPIEPFTGSVIKHFLAWAISPDNNRAPGMTCLRACGNLADGQPWPQATQRGSKGCGANMRVTPIGLVPQLPEPTVAGASQLQAALTHGHATALAASDLTAFATRWLLAGTAPTDLVPALRERCREQRHVYHGDWLGDDLWRIPHRDSPEEFIEYGWDECAAVLDRLAEAAKQPDPAADPCLATGEGWIAEEALATALLCFLMYPDEPVRALGRAAATGGDSDSIAALAGAFLGARHGIEAFPADWPERIEYRDRLARAGAAWDAGRS
ncbi:ADP-ribosylglycohydrolase family protein [Catenulispora pinisilvae]|uniref:ADP-ribosylglycohydrolase family protein n=1 Tax=Catenulispora pinisilvae TaxID=2705253 RepID=UPI001891B85C|nr:ADP-ribosylglycohydrolase family protein [Catenulispora pinisilvae]